MIIYRLVFIFVVISLTTGAEINLRKLFEDAEADSDAQLRREMTTGSTSRRFNRKKFTP